VQKESSAYHEPLATRFVNGWLTGAAPPKTTRKPEIVANRRLAGQMATRIQPDFSE
jgi:hypothetical protein